LAAILEADFRDIPPERWHSHTTNLIFHLAKLDPARASRVIVAELHKTETWLRPDMLRSLPASPQSLGDEELIALLADRPEHHKVPLWSAAAARFASSEAAPRNREVFEQRLTACQYPVVGYFARTDPGLWGAHSRKQLEYARVAGP
jgi:hypothetical protein